MSIRTRMIITVLLVGILPIVAMFVLSSQALNQTAELGIRSAQSSLEQAGQRAMRLQAESVAAQIKTYLNAHPGLDPFNVKALQADKKLASIAIQQVGETGYTAVHDARGVNIFHADPQIVNSNLADLQDRMPDFWKIISDSLNGMPAEGYYDWVEANNTIRRKYMAVVPVEGTPLRVAATIHIEELSAPIEQTALQIEEARQALQSQIGLAAFAASVLAAGAAIGLGLQSTASLVRLTRAVERVAQGEWDAITPQQEEKSEVGAISQSVYNITRQLRDAVEHLEEQVQTRTKELARRGAQLEATTFVASEVARAKRMDTLMKEAAELIHDRFGFYHVGIFLLDETAEYAHLVAAAGETGPKLLESKHQLKVGEASIVGTVAATGYPRIAQNVGADEVYFKNPLLPETRSEMSIPIRSAGEMVGVLDIQSTQENAFDEEDVRIMQILADQMANAIENIRLFERLENTSKEMAAFYEGQRMQFSQLWLENKVIGYEYDRFRVQPIDNQIPAGLREQLAAGKTVALDRFQAQSILGKPQAILLIPIMLRGQALGVIGMESDSPDHRWTNDEITTVEGIAAQVAIALENARLLEEAQQRAFQEKAISDITTKISSSVKIENVLRTTAQELSRILQDAEVLIQLQRREN